MNLKWFGDVCFGRFAYVEIIGGRKPVEWKLVALCFLSFVIKASIWHLLTVLDAREL
jgi:hypothetical protein